MHSMLRKRWTRDYLIWESLLSLQAYPNTTIFDYLNQPVIISSQEMVKNELAGWLGGNQRALNIVATYNLF